MTRLRCYILILVMIIVTIGSGCDRHVPSKDPVRSAPEAPPTPVNLIAEVNDRSLDLSWEISDSSAVTSFRIYRADADEYSFYRFDSSSNYSKTVTGLPFDQPLRFRVTAVGLTGIEGLPSEEVTAVAGLLSIVLDGGDEYTNYRNVSVRLLVPGEAAYMELSEDQTFADALVQPFVASTGFELSQGDGIKTVYARITFADGMVAGEIVSDDIVLDTRALVDSVYFLPTGQIFSAGDTISFFVDAHGEPGGTASVSIPGAPGISLADYGTAPDAAADDGLYSAYYVVPVALTVTDGEVTGNFRDAAGNTAPAVPAVERLNIETTTPPTAVTLAAGLIDSSTVHLTWTQSDDDDFASYRLYRSTTSGIDVGDDSLRIAIINQRFTLSYDDYLPASGTYYYRIFVFDTQEMSAGSNEVVVTQ